MRSSARSGWRSPSPCKSLLAAALAVCAAAASAGCDGECGPGDAPAVGIAVDSGGDSLLFGNFTSSPNNDCTTPGGPTSLAVDGVQVEPTPGGRTGITLCLPRPDLLGDGPVSIADRDLVWLVDVNGEETDGCLIRLDFAGSPEGTIDFLGYCGDGLDSGGFAIEITAAVPALRSCVGGPEEAIAVELGGSVAVEAL